MKVLPSLSIRDLATAELHDEPLAAEARTWHRLLPAISVVAAQLDALTWVEVFDSADTQTRERVFAELGVGAYFRQLQKTRARRAAIGQVVQRVRDTLRSESGQGAVFQVIRSWWGRRAETVLRPTALGKHIAGIPLTGRFQAARSFLSEPAGQAATDVHDALDDCSSSVDALDRVFAGLLCAAVTGMEGSDLGVAALGWLASSHEAGRAGDNSSLPAARPHGGVETDPEHPSPRLERTLPQSGPGEDRVKTYQPEPGPDELIRADGGRNDTMVVDAGTVADARAAPLTAFAGEPGVSAEVTDAGPGAGAPSCRGHHPAPAVDAEEPPGIRSLVEACMAPWRDVQAHTANGEIDALDRSLAAIRDAERAVVAAVTNLAVDLRFPASDHLPLPRRGNLGAAEADAWLRRLAERAARARHARDQSVRADARALAKRLCELGIEEPPDLDDVSTSERLDEVRARVAPAVAVEEAWRALRSNPDATSQVVAHLQAADRFALYQRALFDSGVTDAGLNALGWLCSDPLAATTQPADALDIAVHSLKERLARGRSLPANAWSFLAQVAPTGLPSLLGRADLMSVVDNAEDALLDLAGMEEACGISEGVPANLRLRFEIARASALDVGGRVRSLASLYLDRGRDGRTLEHLVRALVACERPGSALLVSVLAARTSRLPIDRVASKEVLHWALVEAALVDGDARAAVRQLIATGSTAVETTDDIVVLLFLSAVTGARGPYLDLAVRDRDALDDAARTRPALVARFLLGRLLQDGESEAERGAALEAARSALVDWDHDLAKKTPYQDWYEGRTFQRAFNQRLESVFACWDRGDTPEPRDPDEVIDEVSRELRKVIDGAGRVQARQYLARQFGRIEVLNRAGRFLSDRASRREQLERPEEPIDRALAAEVLSSPPSPALRRIYAYAATVSAC